MRRFAGIGFALLLAGCGAEQDHWAGVDPEARRCGELPDISSYSQCIEVYNARVAREATPRQQVKQWAAPAQPVNTPSEDTAALLLMGATAFSNGYTQARPQPMLTCFRTGAMTMCQ